MAKLFDVVSEVCSSFNGDFSLNDVFVKIEGKEQSIRAYISKLISTGKIEKTTPIDNGQKRGRKSYMMKWVGSIDEKPTIEVKSESTTPTFDDINDILPVEQMSREEEIEIARSIVNYECGVGDDDFDYSMVRN